MKKHQIKVGIVKLYLVGIDLLGNEFNSTRKEKGTHETKEKKK